MKTARIVLVILIFSFFLIGFVFAAFRVEALRRNKGADSKLFQIVYSQHSTDKVKFAL